MLSLGYHESLGQRGRSAPWAQLTPSKSHCCSLSLGGEEAGLHPSLHGPGVPLPHLSPGHHWVLR